MRDDTIWDIASEVLQFSILLGELPPGQKISQNDLVAATESSHDFRRKSGKLSCSRHTVMRAMADLAARGLLVLEAGASAIVPDCSPTSIKRMLILRDSLDMLVAMQLASNRSRGWWRLSFDRLQKAMRLANLCFALVDNIGRSKERPDQLLRRIVFVLDNASVIVEESREEYAQYLARQLLADPSRADDAVKHFPAEKVDPPPQLLRIRRSLSDLLRSNRPQASEAGTPMDLQEFREKLESSLDASTIKNVGLPGASADSDVLVGVKKLARISFLMADAGLHEQLARSAGLYMATSVIRMVHTFPDVPKNPEFLHGPGKQYLAKTDAVIQEHDAIVEAVDMVQAAPYPSDLQKQKILAAVRDHLLMTLKRGYSDQTNKEGYFPPKEICLTQLDSPAPSGSKPDEEVGTDSAEQRSRQSRKAKRQS